MTSSSNAIMQSLLFSAFNFCTECFMLTKILLLIPERYGIRFNRFVNARFEGRLNILNSKRYSLPLVFSNDKHNIFSSSVNLWPLFLPGPDFLHYKWFTLFMKLQNRLFSATLGAFLSPSLKLLILCCILAFFCPHSLKALYIFYISMLNPVAV